MNMNYVRELTILVVDDVQVHRFLMISGLARVNPFARVVQAASMQEAIEMLGCGRYHAVVSDWNMAGGGGAELVKWMRARPSFNRVPFIMISGNRDSEAIIRAFMVFDVDAYVVKPFTPEDLYDKIIFSIDKRGRNG